MDEPPKKIVARRFLRDSKTQETCELTIHVPVERSSDSHIEWACRVEVKRQNPDDVHSAEGHGADSLQALINGLVAARALVNDTSGDLVWLDLPGHTGLPMIIQEEDPDLVSLLEKVIDAEYRRQILFKKALRREREREREKK